MLRTPLSLLAAACFAHAALADHRVVDLAQVSTDSGELLRIYGSSGNGAFGTPVAGGKDCDGDGFADFALASMLSSPEARDRAGSVYLLFGDGRIDGSFDSGTKQPLLLNIVGASRQENAGNEIWMDDVTGDGIADLLIGRQNFSFTSALGGDGALSIIVGGPALKAYAAGGGIVDLRSPAPEISVVTLVGGQRVGRLGIWMRTGDITGDGIADIVVGADQEDHVGQTHAGAVYVVRGGPHLGTTQIVTLEDLASSALAGNLARIDAPSGQAHLHFGSTCQVADLDGNGRGEVLVAAALNRAGGVLSPYGPGLPSGDGVGGTIHGTAFILWDDNFPSGPWPADFHFGVDSPPGSKTIIVGGERNGRFGEELVGGRDYDGDGHPDLFIGDLNADLSPSRNRSSSGAGYIFYDAARLKHLSFNLDSKPVDIRITAMIGRERDAISGDTAIDGDFDGDGIADIAIGSPHATADLRADAGILDVLFGQSGGWPDLIDLASLDSATGIRTTSVWGAHGHTSGDAGDVLGYSIAAGDVDADGRTEVVINEMEGDGSGPIAIDVGNLDVIDGALLATGVDLVECPLAPLTDCREIAPVASQLGLRYAPTDRRMRWKWRANGGGVLSDFGSPQSTSYAVCLYDASSSSRPTLSWRAFSDIACQPNSCWSEPTAGVHRYLRPPRGSDGIERGVFRIGDNRDTVEVSARNWKTASSSETLVLPVTVQLISGAGVTRACWQVQYLDATTNAASKFVTH